jgi:hypothetical protein
MAINLRSDTQTRPTPGVPVRRVQPEVDLQALDDRRIRAVTHVDLTMRDIDRALAEINRALPR